jgi:hypothetical protein
VEITSGVFDPTVFSSEEKFKIILERDPLKKEERSLKIKK